MNRKYRSISYKDIDGGVWKQGWSYENEESFWTQDNPLEIIVIPHSHQDPGWIMTVDQYFMEKTKPSLDSSIDFLYSNPNATFIYAEISYLSLWWKSASEDKKSKLKIILNNGQMEIVTGGLVMNDEANTHFFAMIDQLTEGHQWLAQTLNYHPKNSWAIDPFGHSSTMAYIINRMKIENMLIQRTHYEIKKDFALNNQLEYYWIQPWDFENDTKVFCHMMPFYSYDVPHTCGPDPSICCTFDFARPDYAGYCPWHVNPIEITDNNVEDRAKILLDQYKKKAMLYQRHNVLLVPLGDDFRYTNLKEWNLQYTNYQKIFNFINSKHEFNTKIRFGTLSSYFEALKARTKLRDIKYHTLSGDMFTYSDRVKDYWSGYFTSRPFHKSLTRILENEVYVADLLFSIAINQLGNGVQSLESFHYDKLKNARFQLGIFQHHDGITGTAKSSVVKDYGNRMLEALNDARNVIAATSFSLLTKNQNSTRLFLTAIYQTWSNDDEPEIFTVNLEHESKELYIYVFNPTWQAKSGIISFRLNTNLSKVEAVIGLNKVPTNLVKKSKHFVLTIGPIDGIKGWQFQLIKLKLYYNLSKDEFSDHKHIKNGDDLVLQNNIWQLNFDKYSHLLQTIVNKKTGAIHRVQISFQIIPSKDSGAYLFMPSGNPREFIFDQQYISKTLIVGESFSEFTIADKTLRHSIRLYHSGDPHQFGIEVENMLNFKTSQSEEFMITFQTEIPNQDREIFTDANCLQFIRRIYNSKIPLQGNVFPMPCGAYIESPTSEGNLVERFTIVGAQPLGVASFKPGSINVFLDRYLLNDDNRGLQEAIHDTRKTRSTFRILFEQVNAKPNNIDPDIWIPGLTLMAERLSHDLLRPNLALLLNKKPPNELPKFLNLLSEDLPQDFQLVNFKSYVSISELKKSIVVRRLDPVCSIPFSDMNYSLSSENFAISKDAFKQSIPKIKGFYPATITLLMELGALSIQDIKIKKHNLQAVILEI